MNSATLKWLAIATIGLLILVMFVEQIDRSDTVSNGEFLIPDLKSQLNDINKIVVTSSEGGEPITIARHDDRWQVEEKSGFAANVGKLREVLLALADARKLEEKTSNPERFAQLGLEGPEAGSGVMLEISGEKFAAALIIGNVAQSKNRYVRMVDDNQSWLIDKNPDVPGGVAGWLMPDLLDIDASRIQTVTIHHEDGETIHLSKSSKDDSNFTVSEIPKGRELSYATVANGIAGVLNDLKLDDVRRSDAGELTTSSVFTTFDGLEIELRRYHDGDNIWITVSAAYRPPAVPAVPEAAAKAAEETAGDEVAIDDTSDAAASQPSAEDEAEIINSTHAGWQYRIPEYKANLIARRWDDILKAKE